MDNCHFTLLLGYFWTRRLNFLHLSHIFYLFIYIWWNTRYYDVYPLLRRENSINLLKKLPENTLLCKKNKDISKILGVNLQSMLSLHASPAQAVVTVNANLLLTGNLEACTMNMKIKYVPLLSRR